MKWDQKITYFCLDWLSHNMEKLAYSILFLFLRLLRHHGLLCLSYLQLVTIVPPDPRFLSVVHSCGGLGKTGLVGIVVGMGNTWGERDALTSSE